MTGHIPVTGLLFAGVVLYLCVGAVVNYLKLRKFKGPPSAAFSRFWLWRQSLGQRAHIAQKEALAKYGTTHWYIHWHGQLLLHYHAAHPSFDNAPCVETRY
jgi:hypothetical protein